MVRPLQKENRVGRRRTETARSDMVDERQAEAVQDVDPDPETEEPGAGRRRDGLLLIGTIVLSLAIWAAVGSLGLAPLLMANGGDAGAGPGPAETEAAEETHGSDSHDGHGREAAAHGGGSSRILEIDNLIVNPARSGGSRFLMASIAIEVPDQKSLEVLVQNKTKVRHELVHFLSSQSLEALTRPGATDTLREHLREAMRPLAGGPSWIEIYIPQFVIQ
ncbi:MAG: hypothetical protein GF346_07465 [Candidatus Eisenbacteria bacterium]|nr:hypothetical protein [Candidatus Latescibacterota bacterium]MBD3302270.1 hypothetical protein [Candidatus Eisenbacteria bacterium]